MSKEAYLNELSNHAFRENSGKMVAYLCKTYGLHHLDAIGDIVQDTFETALKKWRFNSIPDNPSAWLMTVAKNKAINYFKKAQKTDFIENDSLLADGFIETETSPNLEEVQDSQLRLLLSCCHPGLSEKSQVILTLNILSGFGIQEISSALLMKKEAVKKALMRAKKYLRDDVQKLDPLLELDNVKRVQIIHTVLYLMFNEGYKLTKSKQLINHDLCYESMRLCKLLLTEKSALKNETQALIALQFFTVARYPSRLNSHGSIVLLADQDRSKWNQQLIKEGFYYLDEAKKPNIIHKYLIEATISSLHCSAESFQETPWALIVQLYDKLLELQPSPVTLLNKIVALSYSKGAATGLKALELIEDSKELSEHYLFFAAQGDMLARLKKRSLATRAFKKALNLAVNQKEKELLANKINSLDHEN